MGNKKVELGRVLEMHRNKNKITQTEFCRNSGMHHSQLKAIEAGSKNYTIGAFILYLENIGHLTQDFKNTVNKILTS